MKFRVGDLCEIVAPDSPLYHGRECVVTALAQWMDDVVYCESGKDAQPGMFYTIFIPEGGRAYALEHELRLKRPPSWDSWIHDTRDVEREHKQPVTA